MISLQSNQFNPDVLSCLANLSSDEVFTPPEAAYLAAMTPSPLNVFNPAKNPKRLARRQRVILRGINSMRQAY